LPGPCGLQEPKGAASLGLTISTIIQCSASGSCVTTAKMLLRLLGWRFAEGDAKDAPFSRAFSLLGVSITLSPPAERQLLVGNKPARVEALLSQLASALESGEVSHTWLEEVRGKLQFAAGQVFGRAGVWALAELSSAARGCRSRVPVSGGLLAALVWLRDVLLPAPPRNVPLRDLGPPVLIFTDGACEPQLPLSDRASCGAVLWDLQDGIKQFFGTKVPARLVARWVADGKAQVIAQAELLPVLLARFTWLPRLRGRRLIVYVDNESAKAALIKASSRLPASMELIKLVASMECACQSWTWYARVPSYSNPADGPSRLQLADPPLPDAVAVQAAWPPELEALLKDAGTF
jgi:hypothetical protein